MWLYLTGLSIFELAAQFFLKLSSDLKSVSSVATMKLLYLIIGIVLYAYVGYLYFVGLGNNKMASLSIAWHVVMALITTLIAMAYFKETYGVKEIIGITMGIGSIVLLGHDH
jgi:uncharacterized membrane protein